MRRRLLIVAAVSVLALSACGKSKPSAVDANAGSSTTNAGQGIANPPVGADQGGTPTSVVTGGTGSTVAVSGSGGTTATTRKGSGSAAASTGAYKPTDKGTYTFHTTGKTSSPAFGERPIDADDTQKYDAPSGSDQRNSRGDAQGTTEQVLRYQSDGVRLVSQKVTSQSVTKEFKPNPPVMFLPYPLTKGQEWSWKMTSTDNATTVEGKFKYLNDETINVGGTNLKTYVIQATITTAGDVTSKSDQTIWVSPDLRLSVKEHNVSDGQFGQVTFHSDTTRTLKSTKPS
jgi:hypothetical protein